MKNQKIPISISTAIILIIASTAATLIWKSEKDETVPSESRTVSQLENKKNQEKFEISDNWASVSHGNFWNNPNFFAHSNYNFPNLTFSYPANWKFQCCNDTDSGSEHFIFSSQTQNKSWPYIRIFNYTLKKCSNHNTTCSMDKLVAATPQERFDQIVSDIPKNNILPAQEIKSLNTQAFVYKKNDNKNESYKAYLIKLTDGVIEVDFFNYEKLEDSFIEKFLNQLGLENK